MNQIVIKFDPTGTVCCLYTEAIPLLHLGKLHIHRATSVEFNDQVQQWEVTDPQGKVLFQSASRQACLNWEQANLNP